MKPTSKIIQITSENVFPDFTRRSGVMSIQTALCADGSVWEYHVCESEKNVWHCILEAPESETKKMVENFLIDDLNQSKINYYIQNGWQLVSILENDILVKKDFEKYLTRKEIAIIHHKATLYYEDYSRNKGALFWEEVHKEAEAEYLSEYGFLPSQSKQEDDEIPF